MVKLWNDEVGNARSAIEPIVRRVDPGVDIHMNGGEGFRNDTVEVRLQKGKREARCVVTFEAWEHARQQPEDMEAAFRSIVSEMDAGAALPAYLLTSRGLTTESADKDSEILRDLAAGTEADVLAERLPRHAKE